MGLQLLIYWLNHWVHRRGGAGAPRPQAQYPLYVLSSPAPVTPGHCYEGLQPGGWPCSSRQAHVGCYGPAPRWAVLCTLRATARPTKHPQSTRSWPWRAGRWAPPPEPALPAARRTWPCMRCAGFKMTDRSAWLFHALAVAVRRGGDPPLVPSTPRCPPPRPVISAQPLAWERCAPAGGRALHQLGGHLRSAGRVGSPQNLGCWAG